MGAAAPTGKWRIISGVGRRVKLGFSTPDSPAVNVLISLAPDQDSYRVKSRPIPKSSAAAFHELTR